MASFSGVTRRRLVDEPLETDEGPRLAALPDDTVIFPGHQYSHEPHAAMGRVRTTNAIFKPKSKEAWLGWFGN